MTLPFQKSLGINKDLMSGAEGKLILSPEAETKLKETLRFEGNKSNCFQKDQSLSDLS